MKNAMKKDLTNHFVSAITAILLIAFYAIVMHNFLFRHFLTGGINQVFSAWLWKLLLLLLPFLVFFFVLYLYFGRGKIFSYDKKVEPFQTSDLVFILIPLLLVVQYILSNQDVLDIFNSFLVFSFFAVTAIVFCVLIPVLLSFFASKYILIAASTSFLFVIVNMASLSASLQWDQQGSLIIQLIVLTAAFLILSSRIVIPQKIFSSAVALFFVISIVPGFLAMEPAEKGPPEHEEAFAVEEVLEGRSLERKNDILLLVYESYSNYETMKHYGFDNQPQLSFLEENGFHVYHGVYSLGTPTMAAMTRVFNVDRETRHNRRYLAGNGAVKRLLSPQGYTTCGVFQSDYFFRGLSPDEIGYDLPFPSPRNAAELYVKAILAGLFSDEVSLGGMDFDSYLKQKHTMIAQKSPSSLFMYAHSNNPGHRPSQAQDPGDVDKYIDIHLNRVQSANIEMRKDVNQAVQHNPDAIVIIAGDHGPFLTKSGYGLHSNPGEYSADDIDRYDMQDRNGAFLAIRWPEKDYAKKHDIALLQDIFPAVFAYLYDDETLFDKTRIRQRKTISPQRTAGVYVEDGIVVGGKHDGQPLFVMDP